MGLFCICFFALCCPAYRASWQTNRYNHSKNYSLGYMPFFCIWRNRLAKFEQKLTEMLRPAVEEVGKELLGIEFISAGKHSVLRLFIDHEDGINVDDCAEVSRQVSAILDV